MALTSFQKKVFHMWCIKCVIDLDGFCYSRPYWNERLYFLSFLKSIFKPEPETLCNTSWIGNEIFVYHLSSLNAFEKFNYMLGLRLSSMINVEMIVMVWFLHNNPLNINKSIFIDNSTWKLRSSWFDIASTTNEITTENKKRTALTIGKVWCFLLYLRLILFLEHRV